MDQRRPAVVVFNPSKLVDEAATRAEVDGRFTSAGLPAPRWIATSVEDPGEGAAREALRERPDLVLAMGGDGTVRAVAGVVRGTGVPFAILPAGTGNLLARNLDIPCDDLDGALDVALGEHERVLDVGVIGFMRADGDQGSEPFLVIAGAGIDGYMMRHTRDSLKARVGWLAYAEAGLRGIFQRGFRARVRCDQRRVAPQQVRGVMAANCGLLTGGIRLVPQAEPDDQRLEAVILSPHGIIGWFNALLGIATGLRIGHRSVTVLPGEEMAASFGKPQILQLDSDAVGLVRALDVHLDRGCLPTRAPRPAPDPAPEAS